MLESRDRNPPSLTVAELADRNDGELVRLEDEETRHARSLRLTAGDAVALTDGMGTRRLGRLGVPAERGREVVIEGSLPANEPLAVEFAIAVGNRTHTLWLVEKAAEFGIRRISPIVLFVGPEGGLSQLEVSACVQAGFRSGRLGHTVLRFETAAVAALAIVAHEREIAGARPRAYQGEST